MQALETLPPWAQVTLSVAGFLLAVFVHFKGLLGRVPKTTGDVVVPNVTVANAQVIENLTRSLNESNKLSERQVEKDIEMRFELRRIADNTRESRDLLLRLLGEPRDRDRQRNRERN